MTTPLTPETLSQAVHDLGTQWVAEGQAPSLADINRGLCIAFAKAVAQHLEDQGWDTSQLFDVELANFLALDQDSDGGMLDQALLAKHWPAVQPTQGLTWEHLEQLAFDANWSVGTHIWLLLDGKHYDAQCPEGVSNFLELPFFAEGIREWSIEKGLTPAAPRAKRGPRP